MSGVSPTSDGSFYRSLGDVEEELRQSARRNEDRRNERIQDLEQGYINNLRQKDDDTSKTIQDVKDTAASDLAREREASKSEREDLRKMTYDRFGRSGGEDADALKQQINAYKQDYDVQQTKNQQLLNEASDGFDRRLSAYAKNAELKNTGEIEAERNSALRAYEEASRSYDNRLSDYQQQAESEKAKMLQDRMDDRDFGRAAMAETLDKAQNDFDLRTNTNEKATANQIEKIDRAANQRMEETTARLRQSHNAQIEHLNHQLKEANDAETKITKEKGNATADVIRRYEDDNRIERDRANDAYNLSLENLSQRAKEADDHAAFVNNESLREKDLYFADLLSRAHKESREQQKDLTSTYENQHKEMELQMRRDKALSESQLDSTRTEQDIARNQALESQALTYQDAMARQKVQDTDEIALLKKDIQTRNTSSDITNLSPAAEAAVRKSAVREYEKTMAAEQERNRASEDSIQRSYADRMKDLAFEKDATQTAVVHQEVAAHHDDNTQLLAQIDESEHSKEAQLRQRDTDYDRQTDSMTRNFSRSVEQQRYEYDEILRTQAEEASNRVTALRQEYEFQAKMAQRSFATRESEIVREYDKKMSELKTSYEDQIASMKTTSDKLLRDSERRSKQLLDEQSKDFEQRIAQLEYQGKERERILTDNFQDEMDKMRRTNALISQKKG